MQWPTARFAPREWGAGGLLKASLGYGVWGHSGPSEAISKLREVPMTRAGRELQHKPPGHEQAAPRAVGQRTLLLLVWHLVSFCSYLKAKGIKLKCTHYRKRLRGKSQNFPQQL